MVNSDFKEKGAQVLGISTNAKPAQMAFATSLGGIPYPLLADFHPHGQVSQLYGVYNEDTSTSKRAVIIIDKEGILRFKRIYDSMAELKISEILDKIGKL